MPLILVSTDRFAEHQTPPGHPERPERADVMTAIARQWQQEGGEVVAPREVTEEQLARVHDERYVRQIASMRGMARALDPDTYTSPETWEIAKLAAGACIDAVERVMAGDDTRALALVRPPGHHAERDRAMGFCFFNNVAVAAAHARAIGAARVAVVDYDVHHGNGTQHIFERDPDVLYVSTHQYPFYPGTGAASETGDGGGRGFTVNVPLEDGSVDEDYRVAFDEVVLPVVRQFKPDLLLVSAGFDAHELDPLATMRVTTPAFGAMTMALRQVADEVCGGRIAAVSEGGYHLRALTESIREAIAALAAPAASAPAWPRSDVAPTRGRAGVAAAKAALAGSWRL